MDVYLVIHICTFKSLSVDETSREYNVLPRSNLTNVKDNKTSPESMSRSIVNMLMASMTADLLLQKNSQGNLLSR